jgi:hypothetical protein
MNFQAISVVQKLIENGLKAAIPMPPELRRPT